MSIATAIPAGAYSHGGAVNYANTYWQNYNSQFQAYSDDCTNFVSQALWQGGGHPFAGSPNNLVYNNDGQWWVGTGGSLTYGSTRTFSWSVADDLDRYLNGADPGSSTNEYQLPPQQGTYSPNDIVAGDPIFYHWNVNQPGPLNHAAIQVGIGTDPNGWYGNLVDAHTSSHGGAFWTLQDYNSQWQTTQTVEIHIY